jgi:hypothetical protein
VKCTHQCLVGKVFADAKRMVAVNKNPSTTEKWVTFAPMSATVEERKIHCVRIALIFLIVGLFKKCTPVQEVKNGMLNNILNGT